MSEQRQHPDARAVSPEGDGDVVRPLDATAHVTAPLPSHAPTQGWHGGEPRRRGTSAGGVVIALVVLTLVFGGAAWLWMHRDVRVRVNGSSVQLPYRSTLADAAEKAGAAPAPGNLVSVSGSLLRTGEGWPLSATVDGVGIEDEQVGDYRITGGEDIVIADGNDRMEDYDATTEEVAPKLYLTGDGGPVSYVASWPRTGTRELRHGKVSGETAPGDWVDEVSNLVVVRCSPTPSDGRRLVCLTFDDGPDATYTPQILDVLEGAGAKATFFEIGSAVDASPETTSLVATRGMQLASHGYAHTDLEAFDPEALRKDLSASFTSLETAAGVTTSAVRPPFGSYDASTWLDTQGLVSVMVTWTQDSGDWAQIGASAVASNSLIGLHSGSIILLQDAGGSRAQDVEALPQLIKTLQGRGYELVTLAELLASDDSIPDGVATCQQTMPEGCTWPTEVASDEELAAWEAEQGGSTPSDGTASAGRAPAAS